MTLHLVIDRGGLSSTLQDVGRFGCQRFGISGSGAMDAVAMRIANALVGNSPDTAVIEMSMTGLAATVVGGACRVAVAGAAMPMSVAGRRVDGWRSFDLAEGERLDFGAISDGMYAYLAVAGGFAIEPTLGSLSTHSRSGIGGFHGRALAAGDRLPLLGAPRGPDLCLPEADRPRSDGPVRVVLGPQDDHFTAAGVATFLSAGFRVTSRTDRMGAQLDGPAIEHADGHDIVSDGIVNGSIQVPGNGRPIVLLADRQTTGGYPKIATVIGPDLPKIAQRRPGETIRFVAIGAAEAATAVRDHHRLATGRLTRLRRVARTAEDLDSAFLLGLDLIGGVCSALDGQPVEST
ncbi:biotin-dependent carboxyltransferase [Siculibacillus lacustris]|uniref:Biotin-dependent carboxyltransferase n=1 Tax=Siculibacillus lacustris TaxID=1549641 RepID=A0A4Q9VKC8_9HYPH|nr:biotin-dependent carboxyltransferase family protein [Siculibacillus lacustris]TBW35355.1 biotin-dependent carboxyltransferase [Siculibacillus lacustris]